MAKTISAPSTGSIRSDTFSRNQYGAYIRNRSIPVNPNTPAQSTARGRFTQLSQYWRDNLTTGQRTAWSDYAEQHPTTNSLGETIVLSGQAMFISINGRQLAAGGAIGLTPPGLPAFVFTGLTVVATVDTSGPTAVLTVAGTNGTSGYKCMIYAGPPMSPARVTPPRKKLIQTVSTDAWSAPVSLFAAYTAEFGSLNLSIGKNIWLEGRIIDTSGQLGQQLTRVTTVLDVTP